MSVEELRKKNITEATNIFEYFVKTVEHIKQENLVSWDSTKDRSNRTELILAIMSLWSFSNGQHVFLNKRHLIGLVDRLKLLVKFLEQKDEIKEWVRIYEQRVKQINELGEIGERFVDFSSSNYNLPFCFSLVLEYEASPYWGAIIKDYRKILSILAPVKLGIFHLPKLFRKDMAWDQNPKTGEITWIDKILDSDKPDLLIEDMKKDLELNEFELPYTVYLIILIHSPTEKSVNLHGYLLWRDSTSEVSIKKLKIKQI